MAGKNIFTPLLKKIPKPFKNRYVLFLTFFFAWMVFFDKHNVYTNLRLQKIVNQLEEDKNYYGKKIKEAEEERLRQNVNREKFAREKYFMKKPNEDVFIYVEE